MARIYPASEFQPDFGLPWQRWTEEELRRLPEADLRRRYEAKALAEANAKIDPIQFGWTLEGWREVMEQWKAYRLHLILGGNRSAKSTFLARLVIHAAEKIPEARIRCFHANEARSIEQQGMVWEALPERYKTLGKKKGQNFSIQFSQKNGFTDRKLILPPVPGYDRGAEIVFMDYAQYRNDPQVAEGWWAHIIWLDEEAPNALVETLRPRLRDAKGRLFLTFTTLQGWTPTVARFLKRKKTLRTIPSPFLSRPVPVAEESLSENNCRIYYFQSLDNPFLDAEELYAEMKGKPDDYVLARAHGVPTKASYTPFPAFDETVHVIPHEKLPWLSEQVTKDGKVLPQSTPTFRMSADPSGSKPWFIIWAATMPGDVVYIFDEYPDVSYGEWAEEGSTAEGKSGPAQKPNGFGYGDYIELIQRVEGDREVYERIMDPRLGNTTIQGKEGATSIISEMDELGMTFFAAPGLDIEHGLSVINDRLSYDARQPVSATNHPRLFISDRCQQLIYAMKTYTARGGKDEATKDPIDALRYLLTHGADYIDTKGPITTGRTFSY